jgi:signal transduction histidine kinase
MSRMVAVAGAVIAALALIAATASVVLTSLMRQGTETVRSANHLARHAAHIHAELVALTRDTSAGTAAPHEREAALDQALEAARAEAKTDEDQRLIATIRTNVRELLAASDPGAPSPRDRVSWPRTQGPLQAALSASDTLVVTSSERAATVETRVRLWDVTGTVVGVAVGLLTLIGVPLVLFGVHRLFTRPMLRLATAVRAFASGEKAARAPSTGPAEFVVVATAFNELADTLSRQDEERLAFLGGVAHDLRNPLTALQMALHFVHPNRAFPSESKLRDTFALVTRQVTRLDRMIGDFLDAVRIQRGELDLRVETHDLRDLARNTVELYANASSRHPLMLSLPAEPVDVAVDAMRVEQVLGNLVSNAIKYSPNGGEITVTVRADASTAIIDVRDQGIGISRADQERVFEPFRRNRGANAMAPGVGLGLAVAHRIVDAHMGRIEIESAPGCGSMFRVRLPLVSAPQPQREGAETAPQLVTADAAHPSSA